MNEQATPIHLNRLEATGLQYLSSGAAQALAVAQSAQEKVAEAMRDLGAVDGVTYSLTKDLVLVPNPTGLQVVEGGQSEAPLVDGSSALNSEGLRD